MASVRRQIRIHRPVDEVWAVAGDPGAVHRWFPGIADCTVEGRTRVITTATGLPMPAEIITLDPLQRRFQYRLTAPIVAHHLGTIDVFDLEDGTTRVAYATDGEPDALALVIGGATGGALAELRRPLEDPEDPTAPATSTTAPRASCTTSPTTRGNAESVGRRRVRRRPGRPPRRSASPPAPSPPATARGRGTGPTQGRPRPGRRRSPAPRVVPAPPGVGDRGGRASRTPPPDRAGLTRGRAHRGP
jgi:uncharacterized protein YndB with AHSA1/START domain